MVAATLTIEDIVKKTTDLPTIPAAALKVMREAESATGTASAVAQAIAQDHALSARVLRLANSAYYGLSRQVLDLQEAVVVLGMRSVRNLAVVAATYPWMSKPIKGYDLGPRQMWAHSFGVAVASQLVARRTGKCSEDTAFTAGLLHNVGKVALSVWLENKLRAMQNMALRDNLSFDQVERKILGYDHADVGAYLGESWNLPEILVKTIRYHHRPNEVENYDPIVDCVHIGDFLTMSMGFGLGGDGLRYDISDDAIGRLTVEPNDLDEITLEFVESYHAYEKLFEEMNRE